jgi:hypothetical protein
MWRHGERARKSSVRSVPTLKLSLLVVVSWAGHSSQAMAQEVVEEWIPAQGYLRIGAEPNRRIPLVETGYSLLLPRHGPIVGVVAFLDSRRNPDSGKPVEVSFDAEALRLGLAVLHVTTGNPLDFLFEIADLESLTSRVEHALAANDLEDLPIHFAGLSLGGTRALRLLIFLKQMDGEHRLKVGAVAVVDAPLDMERLWRSEGHAIGRNFHPAAADEGRWVRYLLEEHLGGDPDQSRDHYAEYSPYSYSQPGGGNAVHLRDIPVRAYHEPDVDWWIEHRRKSYYDMNSLDLAALIAELQASGNERAQLITTIDRREGADTGASPHTWSLVDDTDLAEWFVQQSKD